MSGYLAPGESDYGKGAEAGRRQNTPLRFDVRIRTDDLGRFLRLPDHTAELTGTVTFPPLGGVLPVRDGRFNLFTADPATGERRMIYFFRFTGADGALYCLSGHKVIRDDPGLDALEDLTRLFVRVHRGGDEQAPVFGAGELRFHLMDAPALAASIEITGTGSWQQKAAALAAFTSFAWGALRDEYLKDVRPFYDTQYENLVLAGALRDVHGAQAPFFFVSGTHDKGFPWGDGEIFWDLLFAIGDGRGGYRRYAITDRVLEGLKLDIARGTYHYRGPIFRLPEGCAASFSGMREQAPPLAACTAEIEIRFEARALDAVPFPFPLMPERLRGLSSEIEQAVRNALPGEHPLGIRITPHTIAAPAGVLRVQEGGESAEWQLAGPGSFGECERGTFRNLKEPTLLYHYLCAVEPARQSVRVQIRSGTMRNERQDWAKDQIDKFAGFAVSRTASAEMQIEAGRLVVRPLAPDAGSAHCAAPLVRKGDPVIEVNNDQFPTGVFQRRIVEVEDSEGRRSLALEEDMSTLRLEPVASSASVKVACFGGGGKLEALDRVLDATGFDRLVEQKLAASGKPRALFPIAIKPNFMFAYDKRDVSTYTDPELVHHLVKRLRGRGFESIRVVEAQSTYGEYFDKRSVGEMAAYLGYDGSAGYQVVDMTLDAVEKRDFGPRLGLHPYSRAWSEAGFRISFAKNKTHAYSYYTLTLKNIYGALPMANKFKEYHCDRDIYETTTEYLAAFPVDYGLVDAWRSADGPFGVFADPAPNPTERIIGGASLVAVDWVAATKMGLDPMISRHMQCAVQRFGKPRIDFVGDANPYRPWLNVPPLVTLLAHGGMDAEYHFGNLLYMVSSQMDETHFQFKEAGWHIRLLRELTVPLRRTFFLRTGENPTAANRFFSRLFYKLGF